MTESQKKYLHKAETSRPCKWLSIGLQNLADSVESEEIAELIPLVRECMIIKYQSRLNHI